ncbi:MAG: sigma-54-dependent Fis family transcriptional regulator [Lentisphaeria bacterium]|nr:sigma-54-dependent Fis family transcriptional regulator [Lentisphaeria bacterium]
MTDINKKKLILGKAVKPTLDTEVSTKTRFNSPLKLKPATRLSSQITSLSRKVVEETTRVSLTPEVSDETTSSATSPAPVEKPVKKLLKIKSAEGDQTGESTRLTKTLLKPTTHKTSKLLLKTGTQTKTLLKGTKLLTKSVNTSTHKTLKLSRKLTTTLSKTGHETGTTSKILLPHTQKGNFSSTTLNQEIIDPNAKKILIIDDEVSILKVLSHIFKKHGYFTATASTIGKATSLLESQDFDLVITDIKLSNEESGLELLRYVKKEYPTIPVVIITGYATIKLTIEALKQNAFDLVTKPFKMDQLIEVIENALRHEQNINIDALLNQDMKLHFGIIVGEDEKMKKIYSVIKRVAKTDATILIEGEAGTGKPLFAKIVHYCSKRSEEPFITVSGNLLAQKHISAGLIDKMAIKANGGTLFIQDIHLINPVIQESLFKILTTKKALTSSGEEIQVNIRLFASSVKSLKEMQKLGQFSKELYFRMCAFSLNIPALRDHIDDIPLTWNYLTSQYTEENNLPDIGIDNDALISITSYAWPVNVREMKEAIVESIENSDNITITKDDLPEKIRETKTLSASETKANHIGKVAREFLQQQVNHKLQTKNTSLRIKR